MSDMKGATLYAPTVIVRVTVPAAVGEPQR